MKWSRFGYDGKGNFFLTDIPAQKIAALEFISAGISRGGAVYAEQMIPFDQEIAIVASRSADGSFYSYPVVVSQQSSGICLTVKGPAEKFGINALAVKKLEQVAAIIGSKGDIIGVFAVEAFLMGDQILVNEIAPRVHNTGHYSQDACLVSQFEAHLRSTLGSGSAGIDKSPLSENKIAEYFGMRNILGAKSVNRKDAVPLPNISEPLKLHWYQKVGSKPGRKLGHINFTATTSTDLETLFLQAVNEEKSWADSL